MRGRSGRSSACRRWNQAPWFGISLGEWGEEFDITAKRAVESDYWVTGDIIAQQRRNDLPMNTEVRRLKKKE